MKKNKSTLYTNQRNYRSRETIKITNMIKHSIRDEEFQKQNHIDVEITTREKDYNDVYDLESEIKKGNEKVDNTLFNKEKQYMNQYYILNLQKSQLEKVPDIHNNKNQLMFEKINRQILKIEEQFKKDKLKSVEDKKIVQERATRKQKINIMLKRRNINQDKFMDFVGSGKTIKEILNDEFSEEFDIMKKAILIKSDMIKRIQELKKEGNIDDLKRKKLIKKIKNESAISTVDKNFELEETIKKSVKNEKNRIYNKKDRLKNYLKKYDIDLEKVENLSDEELEKVLSEKLNKNNKTLITDREKEIEKLSENLKYNIDKMNNDEEKYQKSLNKVWSNNGRNKISEIIFKVPVDNENNLTKFDCEKIIEKVNNKYKKLNNGISVLTRSIHMDESSPHVHIFLIDNEFNLLKKQMDEINKKYNKSFDYKNMSKEALTEYGELSQKDRFELINEVLKENSKDWRVDKKVLPMGIDRKKINKQIHKDNIKQVSKRTHNNLNHLSRKIEEKTKKMLLVKKRMDELMELKLSNEEFNKKMNTLRKQYYHQKTEISKLESEMSPSPEMKPVYDLDNEEE